MDRDEKAVSKESFIYQRTIWLNEILLNIKMGNVKQIKIKNHTSYFFNDMINIKGFDSRLDEFIEAKNENKYLVFDSTDENKEVLKNTQNFGMGLKMRLRQ